MTLKTVHRQFGSKARVAHELVALVPPGCRVWVEVFAGTAALTLAKPPHPVEHINDMNGDVVNLFAVLRDPDARERLCEAVTLTPWAQGEYLACIGEPEHPDPVTRDPVERARRFLVVSWQGVGGKQANFSGWRLQRDQAWPLGTWSRVPERIRAAAERLKTVYVHQRDCREVVETFGGLEEAVLFLDPPYPLELTGTHRQQVYSVDMTPADHAELAAQLRAVKAKVMVTMAAGSLYDAALTSAGGWRTRDLRVRGMGNTTKTERLFMNFEPHDGGLFAEVAAE